MLIATGVTKLYRQIPGAENMKNIRILKNLDDHQAILRELKRGIKKVSIVGLNMESLEFVSTLRREFPKVHISVIDDNRETVIQQQYGKKVADSIIKYDRFTKTACKQRNRIPLGEKNPEDERERRGHRSDPAHWQDSRYRPGPILPQQQHRQHRNR